MVKGSYAMLLIAVGCCMLTTATAQSTQGWSPAAGCTVEGFRLQPKQVAHTSPGSGVTLHSLAGPSTELYDAGQPDSLAATAAACKANPSCVMFSSDGFLVGAYQTPSTAADTLVGATLGGLLQWSAMDYCPGSCCGTWVADGLEAQLLTGASSPEQGMSSGWQTVASKDLPKDRTPGNYSMDVAAMVRFCSPGGAAVAAQNPKCTPRCQVACCARFAAGIRRWDNKNLYQQCTSECCVRGCGEPAGPNIGKSQAVTAVTASSTADVLKRQYLRNAATGTSQQPAADPKPAAKGGQAG